MSDEQVTHFTLVNTPIGTLLAVGRGGRLVELRFAEDPADPSGGHEPDASWVRDDTQFEQLVVQLEEYFTGSRTSFDLDVQLDGTAFQVEVWQALLGIPYGTTVSYGDIAAAIGRPRAVRAVGGANNRNRLPIVVPCHRVVGADGSLTGFGGGLGAKKTLLDLERRSRAT